MTTLILGNLLAVSFSLYFFVYNVLFLPFFIYQFLQRNIYSKKRTDSYREEIAWYQGCHAPGSLTVTAFLIGRWPGNALWHNWTLLLLLLDAYSKFCYVYY